MSKNIWQIRKQSEQLVFGKSATTKVSAYVTSWEGRCYKDGIPDELPAKLERSGRAPSWHQIALCLLRNDLHLKGLGLTVPGWQGAEKYKKPKDEKDPQISLF